LGALNELLVRSQLSGLLFLHAEEYDGGDDDEKDKETDDDKANYEAYARPEPLLPTGSA
jgi:hypothetical protein